MLPGCSWCQTAVKELAMLSVCVTILRKDHGIPPADTVIIKYSLFDAVALFSLTQSA